MKKVVKTKKPAPKTAKKSKMAVLEIEMWKSKWIKTFPALDPDKQTCKCGRKMRKKFRYRIMGEYAALDYGNCPCGKKALFKQPLNPDDLVGG